MPVGPLAVSDEINLGLAMSIREQTRVDLTEEGQEVPVTPADHVLDVMVKDAGRPGKAQGAGFYSYPEGEKKHLWSELPRRFPPAKKQLPQSEMVDRLMFVQALESVRCLEDGVLTSVADANVGSIFGWGFAPFKGGTLQFINDHGLQPFASRCWELSDAYGERFEPPELVLEMAASGQCF
jgi:3-hydroxyacyl-CoA dehydrogenase/enoyl-CoA hydratase/3-hydroxybutyryl-CoA epimerase